MWPKSTALGLHHTSFKDVQFLLSQDEPSKTLPSIFHRVRLATAFLRKCPSRHPIPEISLPGADKRIVVYYTSLRVVRSTFDHCKEVLTILQGFRVSIDDRDLSMDSTFLHELQGIVGATDALSLPRVFIAGRYMGGAHEIRQLHETGELKKVVQGFPGVKPGVCDTCGGHRFILCDECSGSHKLYSEKGFRICTACNQNGLIRCPSCACP